MNAPAPAARDDLRVVTFGFGGLACAVALLTGAGLWLTAEGWGAPQMGVFVPLALAGVVFAVFLARTSWLRGEGATTTPPDAGHHAADEPALATPSASTQTAHAALGEIDYLMALRHEFRTPLNAVLGFTDVLLRGIDGNVDETQREDLQIIRASGIRLRILLDSALDLTRLANGELRPELETLDGRNLVERAAIEAHQLWAEKRRCRVSGSSEPCLVAVDPARLRRCILVLADFLASGHRQASIELEIDRSEGYVVVAVLAIPSQRLDLDALPATQEVLAAEDPIKIRQWPVAVTSEVITLHHGASLYHGDDPARFVIRLPVDGSR